ncbi:MAG: aryl sulfotransferase [Alphaproteobacteria bacterium]|nr:aryl sulfotransferase [Alphaproteobacteria bacterium]
MSTAARPERKYIYDNMTTDSRRWDGFKPRDGDIIISTPPKCGTTWTQMICALLVFQKTKFERRLSDYTPWLDMPAKPIEEILGVYEAQTHRRFIKTHTPLDGIPYFDNVTYLFVARDPRDAFISMGNHRKNMKPEMLAAMLRTAQARNIPLQAPASDAKAAFRNWISASGIPAEGQPLELNVLHHAQTFWQFRHLPNIHLLHYNDMKADLEGQMRRIAIAAGITVDTALWPELVAAASFEQMKENADTLAPASIGPQPWHDNAAFFNKGEHGQWRGILGDEELALYRGIMNERLEPELAHWLEHGWHG